MRFSVSGDGIQFGASQKRVAARDEFAFQRAVAEHLAEDQRLRQVIVQVRQAGILRDGLFEHGDGLIVLQVIEMVESLIDQGLLPLIGRAVNASSKASLRIYLNS